MPLILIVLLSLVLPATGALAQGFQVRPLFVSGEVPPGTDVRIPIELTPTSELEGRTIGVEIAQLAQTPSGAFRAIAFDGAEAPERSAAPWITAPSEITLEAREPAILELAMQVPVNARGTYAAALVLTAPPPPDATGLRLTLRILVPIVIGTEGRPARMDVPTPPCAIACPSPRIARSNPIRTAFPRPRWWKR